MRSAASEDLTGLLRAWSGGDARAADKLVPLVYQGLRRLAARHLRRERPGHTLRPTALVHEAWLRLAGQQNASWSNRRQFFAVAAQAMRRVLVDHARARRAGKRAGSWQRVTLDEDAAIGAPPDVDVVALDLALGELAGVDPGKARLVELRFFGGLGVDEAAEVLGKSTSTVTREWRLAKAFLYRRLHEGGTAPTHDP